ncbi:META domain-containing protein [Sediminitomix flava]|uniref:META domain-containing protein n=1 Tax=Sediminitomix flava TaxID=379075 RepID=A0A315ZIT1_SEDFL|nr:META domain-containing protein [Sediminitomix flava]PWJ44728.1 META domain-containing protein [Sediminitomix flava]
MKKKFSILTALFFCIATAFAQDIHPNAEKLASYVWEFKGYQSGKDLNETSTPATLQFAEKEGTWSMNAKYGNTIFGKVNSVEKKTIEISDQLGMTMMVSPEGEMEFVDFLKNVTNYKIKKDKLFLMVKGSNQKMVFEIKENKE